MNRVLKIDPEFQNKIPPLTEAEFKQLEENVLADGEVYEPIVTWNGTIVDGHNRWKIIQAHPEIPYKVKEIQFESIWEAFDWMYKKQLGRRNLTDEQKTYLLGKLYEARKHSNVGNHTSSRNADGTFQLVHNGPNGESEDTALMIAHEQGVGKSTVKRAEKFAHGIDAIREQEPELADSIVNAQKHVSKKTVMDVGHARPEVQKIMIDDIKSGNKKRITKAETKELNSIAETLTNESVMEYTVQHLTEQIRMNAEAFIRSLSNLITDHMDIVNEYQAEIEKAIEESITGRIKQIKEVINNGTQL